MGTAAPLTAASRIICIPWLPRSKVAWTKSWCHGHRRTTYRRITDYLYPLASKIQGCMDKVMVPWAPPHHLPPHHGLFVSPGFQDPRLHGQSHGAMGTTAPLTAASRIICIPWLPRSKASWTKSWCHGHHRTTYRRITDYLYPLASKIQGFMDKVMVP